MKSMTGFGFREEATTRFHTAVEVKAYNSRYLDLYVYLPPHLSPLEPKIRQVVGQAVVRGRVEVSVRVRELEEAVEVRVDRPTVKAYFQALKEVAQVCGFDEEIRLSDILQLEGVVKADRGRDVEEYAAAVMPVLQAALADFEAQRVREGAATKDDVGRQLRAIEEGVEAIGAQAGRIEEHFRTQVKARFEEVTGGAVDENRVLTEIASLLVRYSINEELVRLNSHLRAFRTTMEEEGPVGKRLDFLCQEINREVNTMGSKSVIVEVSRETVGIKDALEKIREQLRNVE